MENWRKPAACRVLRALFLDASFLSDYTHFPVENKAVYPSDLWAAAALCMLTMLFRNGMLHKINGRKRDVHLCTAWELRKIWGWIQGSLWKACKPAFQWRNEFEGIILLQFPFFNDWGISFLVFMSCFDILAGINAAYWLSSWTLICYHNRAAKRMNLQSTENYDNNQMHEDFRTDETHVHGLLHCLLLAANSLSHKGNLPGKLDAVRYTVGQHAERLILSLSSGPVWSHLSARKRHLRECHRTSTSKYQIILCISRATRPLKKGQMWISRRRAAWRISLQIKVCNLTPHTSCASYELLLFQIP